VRADAQRNRALVLDAAIAAFAAEGLAVPVHEIARRAGVSTGTVSRHFPTKDDLYLAIVMERVEQMVQRAGRLAGTLPAGEAFTEFFASMVRDGAVDQGLADALTGAGFDIGAAADTAEHDVMGALRGLLERAQQAGAVRQDVDVDDVKALVTGCLARGRDDAARDRMLAIAEAGLRPPR
jgi:AcrR family transcriptional regulator